MAGTFWTSNNAAPTTAAQATQTTGTAIRTMLQIAPPANQGVEVRSFGIEFASALTAAATIELIETDVAATGLTAAVAAGVQPYNKEAISDSSLVQLGTGLTGYTASTTCTEGTTTATRTGKYKVLPIGASEYEWEWPLGEEWAVQKNKFCRVRITTSVSIGVLVWVSWKE